MSTMIGMYRPGASVVHRMPAGPKLTLLVIAGAASFLVRTPTQTAAALVIVLVGYAVAGLSPRVLLGSLRPLVWVLVPLGIFQAVVAGWERSVVIIGVIVALVLLANLVTLTTRTSDIVDVVVRVFRRLHLPGVNPERVGLMLHLAIRSVPLVVELAADIRDAQRARGQTISARAFAVPLIVGALRRADGLGDALAARGFDD